MGNRRRRDIEIHEAADKARFPIIKFITSFRKTGCGIVSGVFSLRGCFSTHLAGTTIAVTESQPAAALFVSDNWGKQQQLFLESFPDDAANLHHKLREKAAQSGVRGNCHGVTGYPVSDADASARYS